VPDSGGRLTAEEKQKAADWVNRHWTAGSDACPICGSTEWFIGDHLVQPITLGPNNGLLLGGIGYPQVMVISALCGYTMFINAVIMGLAPQVHQVEASSSMPIGSG
jgi:hypothetical protein